MFSSKMQILNINQAAGSVVGQPAHNKTAWFNWTKLDPTWVLIIIFAFVNQKNKYYFSLVK